MRKLILTTLIALPLLAASAFAASDSGTVGSVNVYTGTIQLSDGATYYVPNRLRASKVQQGDTVRIQYERQNGSRIVSDIVKTGHRSETVITPANGGAGLKKNFMNQRSTMCDARSDNRNPCFLGS